jgi:glycine cleavage system H protein
MASTSMKFAPSHEWAKLDNDIVTVGITSFAVEQLTEPTFLEVPKVGRVVKAGEEVGIIESVKSTSPIYSPVAGEVIEVNTSAVDDLGIVNSDPMGQGWMFKVKLTGDLNHLLEESQYKAQIAGH